MRKFSDFDYKDPRNDWNHAEITFIPQISREILIFIVLYLIVICFLLFMMTGDVMFRTDRIRTSIMKLSVNRKPGNVPDS